WTNPSLAATASMSVSFTAQVVTPLANGTTIPNQASIGALEPTASAVSDDPSTATLDDPTIVTITSAPNLSTTAKTVLDVNGAPVRPGDALEYSLAVTNTGTAIATNVIVIVPQDGGVLMGSTITWNAGAIAPSETRTLRFAATVRTPLLNGTQV